MRHYPAGIKDHNCNKLLSFMSFQRISPGAVSASLVNTGRKTVTVIPKQLPQNKLLWTVRILLPMVSTWQLGRNVVGATGPTALSLERKMAL